jgi:hypothetical protein
MVEPGGTDHIAGKMPIGNQDFKDIRENDCFYIDKSDMVLQILSKRVEVYQFTRPRRFGKSLNLSMLDAFFNLKYPKDNKWFDGLKVSECEECHQHRNSYPVINISLKDLEANSYNLFLRRLSIKVSSLYSGFEFLYGSDRIGMASRSRFKELCVGTSDEALIMDSLRLLSDMLHTYYGKKVIILIDEYDNAIHNTYGLSFQKDVLSIMRGIFSSALKDNDNLEFAVVTGVM